MVWFETKEAITISGGGYIAVVFQHDTNNIDVSLTATITRGSVTVTKTYDVIVLKV